MPRPPRSDEEQAALAAALVNSLAVVDEERRRRRAAEAEFLRPAFTRGLVCGALGVPEETFVHWQTRDQVTLDADAARVGRGWRLYSARDILRLGVASRLSAAGFPASKLRATIERIETVFPFSTNNPYLAANLVVSFAVLPSGDIAGPLVGTEVDLEEIPAGVFILVRMDALIRSTLERVGVTMVHGNADDHRAAIERMAGRGEAR